MTLPTDITYAKVSSERLKIPLTRAPPSTESDVQDFVIKEIMKLVEDADGDAILLIDACTIRHHVVEEVRELALKTRLPVYAAPMGKSAIPESYERYGGVSVIFCLQSFTDAHSYLDICRIFDATGHPGKG